MQAPRRPRRRIARDEAGFTLTEVVLVMLLVAVLAALVLPLFLEQQQKGMDAAAKGNARNLLSQVRLCQVEPLDYTACDGVGRDDRLPGDIGLAFGSAPGQVYVSSSAPGWFEVTAVSEAESDGRHHLYRIRRALDGTYVRSCTAGPADTGGACKSGEW